MNRLTPLIFLILLAAAITCFAAPIVIIMLAFSFVGLPLAIFILAAPTLTFLFVAASAGQIVIPGWKGCIAGFVFGLAILAIAPFQANSRLQKSADILLKDDHDEIVRPLNVRTIALLRNKRSFGQIKNASPCDDFCRKALLNKQASRILIGTIDSTITPNELRQTAYSFRMEQRPTCPPVKLEHNDGWLLSQPTHGMRVKSSVEVMNTEIARGNCLIEETLPIEKADVIITAAQIMRGIRSDDAGFDILANTISAGRIAVYLREGQNFKEVFRKTGVHIYKLAPILVPTQISGYGLNLKPGYLRLLTQINLSNSYSEIPDWPQFISNNLALDMTLRDKDFSADRRALIEAAFNKPGGPDSNTESLINDLFASFSQRPLTSEDRSLVTRIVSDRRVSLPFNIWQAFHVPENTESEYFERLNTAGLDRIEEISRRPRFSPQDTTNMEQMRLASILVMNSRTAIPADKSRLESLAHNRKARISAFRALYALSNFGEEAVPLLLFLIDDARTYGLELQKEDVTHRDYHGRTEWQHPYIAGVTGLCLAGTKATTAIPELERRLREGNLPTHASYGELARYTFRSLGMTSEALWNLWTSVDPTFDRKRFDQETARKFNAKECSKFG